MKTDSTLENRLACAFVPMLVATHWPTRRESDFPGLHPPDTEVVKRWARLLAGDTLASRIGTLDLGHNQHTFDLVVRTFASVYPNQHEHSGAYIAQTVFEYIEAAYELLTTAD